MLIYNDREEGDVYTMNYLKRAIYSIKQKLIKNILITLIFSVIFTVTIGAIVLYTTSQAQIEYMKSSIGNSVTLKNSSFWNKYTNTATPSWIFDEEIPGIFIDSEYVDRYNMASFTSIDLKNIKGVYEGEADSEFDFLLVRNSNTQLYMVVDSAFEAAFSVNGYRLVEGEHFTQADFDRDVCIISEQLAEKNNLKLGDKIEIQNIYMKNVPIIDVEIIGIFSAPESDYVKGVGYRPEEIIFAPLGMDMKLTPQAEGTARGYVTVYLKNMEEIEAFIAETKAKINISEVRESHFKTPVSEARPEKLGSLSGDDFADYISANPIYNLNIDREWYNMLAGPIEKVNVLAGVMTIAMLTAALIIIVLISILSLKGRKKEFGVLLSMGESRPKVVAQIAVEIFVPIMVAMIIGIFAGVAVGVPVVENMAESTYTQQTVLQQGKNDITTYAHRAQSGYSREILLGSAWLDLISRSSYDVLVPPIAKAQVNSFAVLIYVILVTILVFISIIIQMVSVLRIKPARILTGKG